jgi:hypothetical protein
VLYQTCILHHAVVCWVTTLALPPPSPWQGSCGSVEVLRGGEACSGVVLRYERRHGDDEVLDVYGGPTG